jgi:hypothetical protein
MSFSGNPNLLVQADVLQDFFVDKTSGLPMAAGTISFYHDNSRTTFKNVFQLTGQPGAYTFQALPNPMTLTAVGTMADANGNDIIPFYYPFASDNITPDPYYITVDNSVGTRQFTRQSFPFPSTSTVNSNNPTLKNYITNGVFWRNIGNNGGSGVSVGTPPNTISINGSNYFYTTLAPSSHDGFSMPDIIYLKNKTGATETVSFNVFAQVNGADQIIVNDITPEYYLNVNCSGATTGETLKCIQIPISLHIKSLAGATFTIVFDAQNNGGAANGVLTAAIFQFLGTGQTQTFPTALRTFTLNSSWTKYMVSATFPPSTANIGVGGDDALYLQIGLPLNQTFNINIAKPSLYLSNSVPTNDTDTYDQVDAIIHSPRTGDVRASFNAFQPFGWTIMNDGTICNTGSITPPSGLGFSRQAQDTWPLFNLLWSSFKAYDTGSNSNPICQIYSSAGAATNYGATAIADFTALKQLALTKMMGRVILGDSSALVGPYTQTITAAASSYDSASLLVSTTSTANYWNGMPVIFTNSGGALPGNIVANTIYYVGGIGITSANTFYISTTFANAITVSNKITNSASIAATVVQYSSTGSGTNTVQIAPAGAFSGEYAHVQLLGELAAHTHQISVGTGANTNTVGNNGNANTGTANTGSTGSNLPFNIVQPYTLANLFIKL